MKRIASAGLLLFAVSVGLSQTPVNERNTLQAPLDEVHQLRHAIEGMTSASQRVQIALIGLQMQDSVVARAMQRLDNARNKCSGAEGTRQHTAEEMRRMESSLGSGTISDVQAKEFKERLPALKSALEVQTADVQTCQVAEAEVSSQLRNDQAKLLDLQDRIARLDKALEQLGATDPGGVRSRKRRFLTNTGSKKAWQPPKSLETDSKLIQNPIVKRRSNLPATMDWNSD